MIEAYVDNGISVLKIAQSLKQSSQTIHKVVTFLKQGEPANDYYQTYKVNKARCGRHQAILSNNEKSFIQSYLKQDCNLDGHSEKRGKQAFRRDLRERAEKYPTFETEFGHLEGDTIVGKNHKSAAITLVEHLSKYIITLQTNGRKASDAEISISSWMAKLPKHIFISITFDCGKEFSNWKSLPNEHSKKLLSKHGF